MKDPNSPFNWQGKPSIFAKDHAFTGLYAKVSERSTRNAGPNICLRGSNLFLAGTFRQIIAHSRATPGGV